jgi:hypothetical protein
MHTTHLPPHDVCHVAHDALHGQALGHTHGPHFNGAAALDDLNGGVADGTSPQVLQASGGTACMVVIQQGKATVELRTTERAPWMISIGALLMGPVHRCCKHQVAQHRWCYITWQGNS